MSERVPSGDSESVDSDSPMGIDPTSTSIVPASTSNNFVPATLLPTTPSQRTGPATSASLMAFLKAPERERGRAASPTKFTTLKKRQRAPETPPQQHQSTQQASNTLETHNEETIEQDDLTTIKTMLQKVLADNQDLRHQISVLAAQMVNMQTEVKGVATQVTGLSQQVARSAKINPMPPCPPATEAPPPAPTPPPQVPAMANRSTTAKPRLRLSLQQKQGAQPQTATTLGATQQAETMAATQQQQQATYATTAATKDGTTGFTLVGGKKTRKTTVTAPKTLKPLYDPNDQKVIIQLHPDTPPREKIEETWQYLQLANKAVREYQKDLDYCFIGCHVTLKKNLVLQTSFKTRGSDYLPYLEAIKVAFEERTSLRVTSIDGEPRWSKFILHGVPVTSTMEEVALSIQESYPGVLKLAQTPRWLTTDAKRQNSGKGMSSVVLSIAGQHTLQSLGYQYLFVCNSRCRLAKYLPFGPSSQCGNCCKFGHPTTMCQDKHPTCGVCGKEHLTRHHPCPAPDCRGGGYCTHTPVRCVNCQNSLHSSINPLCPTKAKVRQQKQNTEAITEFDTTIFDSINVVMPDANPTMTEATPTNPPPTQ